MQQNNQPGSADFLPPPLGAPPGIGDFLPPPGAMGMPPMGLGGPMDFGVPGFPSNGGDPNVWPGGPPMMGLPPPSVCPPIPGMMGLPPNPGLMGMGLGQMQPPPQQNNGNNNSNNQNSWKNHNNNNGGSSQSNNNDNNNQQQNDRVNCPFFFKIGLCRHGDQCSRMHTKVVSASTLILRQMYQSPIVAAQQEGHKVDDELIAQAQEHLDHFYEEVWTELARYGKIEDMQIIDNLTEHMVGTVYVRFSNEDEASEAMKKLSGRFYGGKLIQCELSHITDFQDARLSKFKQRWDTLKKTPNPINPNQNCVVAADFNLFFDKSLTDKKCQIDNKSALCRQFDEGTCTRGLHCNFIHWKGINNKLKKKLIKHQKRDGDDSGQVPPFSHKFLKKLQERKIARIQKFQKFAAEIPNQHAHLVRFKDYFVKCWNVFPGWDRNEKLEMELPWYSESVVNQHKISDDDIDNVMQKNNDKKSLMTSIKNDIEKIHKEKTTRKQSDDQQNKDKTGKKKENNRKSRQRNTTEPKFKQKQD